MLFVTYVVFFIVIMGALFYYKKLKMEQNQSNRVNTVMPGVKYKLEGVNGQLTVYENKIVIERNNLQGFLGQGLAGTKTIPMSAIQSVQFRKGGAIRGFIQFTVIGGIEKQGGVSAAVNDENSVILTKECNELAQEITNYIENKILEHSTPTTVVQQMSVADELKKFNDLLDRGVISQEEFEAKKKQLLGL